jgi:hypothetical protein
MPVSCLCPVSPLLALSLKVKTVHKWATFVRKMCERSTTQKIPSGQFIVLGPASLNVAPRDEKSSLVKNRSAFLDFEEFSTCFVLVSCSAYSSALKTFLRNVGWFSTDYIALYYERHKS